MENEPEEPRVHKGDLISSLIALVEAVMELGAPPTLKP
jgi:hypothetical protein